MAGLLYKDFAAIKGKWWLGGFVAIAAVSAAAFCLTSDDLFFANLSWYGIVAVIMLGYMLLIGRIQVKLLEVDEGRKRQSYLLSLPVSKNSYVASKYLFLFAAFLLVMLTSILLFAVAENSKSVADVSKTAGQIKELSLVIASIAMLFSVVELPFFIGFGTSRGNRLKIAIMILFCFVVIVYLLFGDLHIFDRFSLQKLMIFLLKHKEIFSTVKVALPCITIAAYYLSYKLSCILFARRKTHTS